MQSILQILKNLGLSENEAKIFIQLSKIGPQKVGQLSKQVELSRVQLYKILKSLQKKAIVESTFEYPTKYNAIPLDRVLDMFIANKEEEATILRKKKKTILQNWNDLSIQFSDVNENKFMVLQSNKIIFSKIRQMIKNTKEIIYGVSNIEGFFQTDMAGIHDLEIKHSLKDKIHFRFLTNFNDLASGLSLVK